jgi:threonine 3-dehydrogenase
VLALSGRRIFATWYKTRWLLESGVVDLRPLITHEYPLEAFETAFNELDAGEACKIVLHPTSRAVPASPTPAVEQVPALAGAALSRWRHR